MMLPISDTEKTQTGIQGWLVTHPTEKKVLIASIALFALGVLLLVLADTFNKVHTFIDGTRRTGYGCRGPYTYYERFLTFIGSASTIIKQQNLILFGSGFLALGLTMGAATLLIPHLPTKPPLSDGGVEITSSPTAACVIVAIIGIVVTALVAHLLARYYSAGHNGIFQDGKDIWHGIRPGKGVQVGISANLEGRALLGISAILTGGALGLIVPTYLAHKKEREKEQQMDYEVL